MRSPANSLSAELRRTAQAAREAKATELFGLDAVRDRLTQAASAGFDFVTIDASDGVDLRATAAGQAVITWAAETKLSAGWEARPSGLGADGTSSWSLTITWKKTVAS